MDRIKIVKAGKWQDKPYQPQFEVEVEEEIEVGAGTVVEDGKAKIVSYEISQLMKSSGTAKGVAGRRPNPAKEDKARAERS